VWGKKWTKPVEGDEAHLISFCRPRVNEKKSPKLAMGKKENVRKKGGVEFLEAH